LQRSTDKATWSNCINERATAAMQLLGLRFKRGSSQAASLDVEDRGDMPAGHVIIRLRDAEGQLVAEAHLPAFETGLLGAELTRAAAAHLHRGLTLPELTTRQVGRA
jgi:hypothetical protein